MDFYEVIRKRRSIRSYEKKDVKEDKLKRILEAGRLAPSAYNYQPWHLIVVKDKEKITQLGDIYANEWLKKVPVIIVVCVDPSKSWTRSDGESFWKVDGAIITEHIVLAAANEGLASCWVCSFNEEKIKKALGIPKHIRVLAMLPIGYPAEKKGEVNERKPLNEILHLNQW